MTKPGITDLPVRSSTCAPAGTFTDEAGPRAAMVPSRMTSVWSARACAPVPSMTRTWVRATTGVSTATYRRTLGERAGCCAAAGEGGRASPAARASSAAHAAAAERKGRTRNSDITECLRDGGEWVRAVTNGVPRWKPPPGSCSTP